MLKNPKFALIRTISNPTGDIDKNERPYQNSPFLIYDPNVSQITDLEDLYKHEKEYFSTIQPAEINSNLLYLKRIVDKLQNNDIKVILFITPHSKIFLDYFPENERNIFEDIIKSVIIFYILTMRVQAQLLYSYHNKMSELL